MRISFAISSLRAGGAERVLVSLAHGLQRIGHDIQVVTEAGAEQDHYVLGDGVRRVALSVEWTTTTRGQKLKANLLRLRRLRAAFGVATPQAIIAFGETTNVRVLLSCLGTGIPVIVSERVDPRCHRIPRVWDWLRRRLYPRAAAVVVQTESVAQWARSFVAPARVHVIPNPVRSVPTKGPRLDRLPSGNIVIAVGRLTEQKGFPLLIEAFARSRLSEQGWHLVILGEGPDRGELEAQVRALGLRDSVTLPGVVETPEHWLQHADIFVLSSLFEGFPNALLEAMACGVASIAFDCPSGPAEIVRPNETGLLLPPADIDALAAALRKLAADPQRRATFARAAQADVRERFALAAVVKQWESLTTSISRPRVGQILQVRSDD